MDHLNRNRLSSTLETCPTGTYRPAEVVLGEAPLERVGAVALGLRPAAVLLGRTRKPRPFRGRRAPLALGEALVEFGAAVELGDAVLFWRDARRKSRKQPACSSRLRPRTTLNNLTRPIECPGLRHEAN